MSIKVKESSSILPNKLQIQPPGTARVLDVMFVTFILAKIVAIGSKSQIKVLIMFLYSLQLQAMMMIGNRLWDINAHDYAQ